MDKQTMDWEKRFNEQYIYNNSELFRVMGSRYVENLRQFITAELTALKEEHAAEKSKLIAECVNIVQEGFRLDRMSDDILASIKSLEKVGI
jgi:hypothetical protein